MMKKYTFRLSRIGECLLVDGWDNRVVLSVLDKKNCGIMKDQKMEILESIAHADKHIMKQAKRIEELEAILSSSEAGQLDFAKEMRKIHKKQLKRIEELKGALVRIDNWAKAYSFSLSVLPELDFKKVAKVLKAAGLSLDEVSASNMRHVLAQVKDITKQVLKE